MQMPYLGKLSNPRNREFSIKLQFAMRLLILEFAGKTSIHALVRLYT